MSALFNVRYWKVIGNWMPPPAMWAKPEIYRHATYIEDRLDRIVTNMGFRFEMVSARVPTFKPDSHVREWHHDGSNPPIPWIILWANEDPTEFLPLPEFKLPKELRIPWTAQPGDLVLVNNPNVQHRFPAHAMDGGNRYFARFWAVRSPMNVNLKEKRFAA